MSDLTKRVVRSKFFEIIYVVLIESVLTGSSFLLSTIRRKYLTENIQGIIQSSS